MRTVRARCCVVSGLILLGGPAHADLVGVVWERDLFALDGVTPLSDLPGYSGQAVYNIYAHFDDETDQAVGVDGSPTNPFSVYTIEGSGFVNTPPLAGDTPPSSAVAKAIPSVNWDSFMTIGVKLSDQFSTPLIVRAGTPGPNTDSWPTSPATSMNMAWVLPPSVDGQPTPETFAGPNLRVLIMRIVVDDGSVGIEGHFGLLWLDTPEIGGESGVSFAICPGDTTGDGMINVEDMVDVILAWGSDDFVADIYHDGTVDVVDLIIVLLNWGPCAPQTPLAGACCLPSGGCADFTSAGCAALGGEFQGPGVPCTPPPCAPPVGACCFGPLNCTNTTARDCATRGGSYQGDGTACGSGVCGP
jgi:hypothetical protein